MDLREARVAMLCKDSPHHAHEGFAGAVDADIVSFPGLSAPVSGTVIEDLRHGLRTVPTDYDVYLAEGTSDLYLAVQLAIRADALLVYLCDDHRLFGLDAYSFSSSPVDTVRRLDRTLDLSIAREMASRYVDGVVAGSTLAAEFTGPVVGENVPHAVANPYIHPDAYDRLDAVTPSLEANVAVTIGISRDHKGVDRLVDAWPAVRRAVPDAELYIVGPGYPNGYADVSGVHLMGYVNPGSLNDVLKRASVYVHPARVEAFGVTVVEAMWAGLPTIVTETTGARTAVERLHEEFVTPSSTNAFTAAICDYFGKSRKTKSQLSSRARNIATEYDRSTKQDEFKEAFTSVLNRCGR